MFLEWLTGLKEASTYVYQFYFVVKDMIKDTDGQPDKEMHRARSRRVLSTGTCLCGVGEHYSLDTCMHSPAQVRSSPNPLILGFLWQFHYVGTINY